MNILYLYLAIYCFSLIGIGIYLSRKESSEDYLIGGRNRAGWQILLSKFTGSIFASLIGLIIGMQIVGLEPILIVFILGGSLIGLLYSRPHFKTTTNERL